MNRYSSKYVYIVQLLMLFFITSVYSQNAEWVVYNSENSGLPPHRHFEGWLAPIMAITIDKEGNKWIGTEGGGLAKFDGTDWTVYNGSNSDLPSNDIYSIVIDDHDNKWIGTNVGLAKFDGDDWTIYKNMYSNHIYSIIIDDHDNKWIGTIMGLAMFDGDDWTFYWTNNSDLPSNQIYSMAIDESGNKWIGAAGGGLARFDGENWTVYDTENSDLPDNTIYSIAIDEDGKKWIGTFNGMGSFNDTEWSVYDTSNSSLPDGQVRAIAIDGSGNKWIGIQYEGLTKFDGSNWGTFLPSNSDLPNENVYSITIDEMGNKWIGTGNGLAVYKQGGIVSVEELSSNEQQTPNRIALYQNYPNPFNPATTILYSVSKSSHVTLSISNLLGQEIARLMDSVAEPGIHEITFDATHLPSGVYIYRLQTGEYVESKKMLYLK
jgi:ligand-binding sensor domain-containing protein